MGAATDFETDLGGQRPVATARTARPVPPDAATQGSRANQVQRPKTARRARVLGAEQIAGSGRAKPETKPSKPRDLSFSGDEVEQKSKIGSAINSIGHNTASLVLSVASLGERFKKVKTGQSENPDIVNRDFESEDQSKAEGSLPASDHDFYSDAALPSITTKPHSVLARFDTALMGVLSGIVVSCVGLISASVLIG